MAEVRALVKKVKLEGASHEAVLLRLNELLQNQIGEIDNAKKEAEKLASACFERIITIDMRVSTGDTFEIKVCAGQSIDELKAKIQETKVIPAAKQRLLLNSQELQGSLRLMDLDCDSNPKMRLLVFCEYQNETIQIRNLSGQTFSLQAASTDTVEEIKEKFQDISGIPVDQQRLIHAGMQLVDDTTLGEYGIAPGSRLDLVLRLRGGMHHPSSGREDYSCMEDEEQMEIELMLDEIASNVTELSRLDARVQKLKALVE